MKQRSWTDNELIEACKTSLSIRQVLMKLNLSPKGGSYKIVKNHIIRLKIDISHFLGMGHLKGKTHNWGKAIPLNEILVENSKYQSTHHLKNRLLKENIFYQKCYKCGNIDWLGLPISLELEHINGISTDNRLQNLTLLCPNCHSQTLTYRGKNKKHG